ncbi:enoyl-CoA hydratase/isomerase family protein [Coxiella endosymbiont of Ornithodoros amblus]|uniref:enoyl-CoA hydratase-related protein n=1 Tax=Coxiella endosymbiont of Ornithodoros amblus TaxID=1656166 RepID=UPI00244DE458|nr:enoyl-CoA hydratase-related protein [Coxiella endosymbiont of Ornithodoros amblus]MBW5803085.1 enoyl-CoA hydratase/isomerase family protein [Coxiella endosymbiont of Ornithodoros amblus]
MTQFDFIQKDTKSSVSTLTLNRPDKHNTFNEQVIFELKCALQQADEEESSRVIIIKAEGSNFCAGADLNWIKRMAEFTREENEADALAFADLLQLLSRLSKPTIALIQGCVMGGGIGLVACCDITIAVKDSQFCFSEVKLGLVPATIAPYVIRSIGYSSARRYFLTAEVFNAVAAKKIGLIHQVIDEKTELLSIGHRMAQLIIKNGPHALCVAKQLLNDLCPITENIVSQTAVLLTDILTSSEAREGIQKFLKGKI